MERVADPGIVSALLSLVLANRNRLSAIGYNQVSLMNADALHWLMDDRWYPKILLCIHKAFALH